MKHKKRTYKKIGCMSGGTGVTPCFQLMQHTANQGMKVNYTVDRVPEGVVWGGFVGFVTEDMVKSTMPEPGPDTLILACGPPIMVDKCLRPICEKLGYEFEAF